MKFNTILTASLAVGLTPLALGQDRQITVPDAFLDAVGEVFPERSNAGSAYINGDFESTLEMQQAGTVALTFIHEGAGYRNSLGYFTYEENGSGGYNILSSNLVIPDASIPLQTAGDEWDLRDENGNVRTFQAGDKIGFFVIANGWNSEPRVRNFDASAVAIPANNGFGNAQIGLGCYTSIPQINPEWAQGGGLDVAKHQAMVGFSSFAGFNNDERFVLIGFEDLNRLRWSDDDFNDLSFVVHTTPETCLSITNLWPYSTGDTDSDGVLDIDDAFPNDPQRSGVLRIPRLGEWTLGFEDLYPLVGDADYNDVVIAYHYYYVTNASGLVVDVTGEYHLVGRGATLDHEFGIHIPGIPNSAAGTYSVERFLSDGSNTVQNEGPTTLDPAAATGKRFTVFPSTLAALPPIATDFTNVGGVVDRPGAGARLYINFTTPVNWRTLGWVPFDPYISFVKNGLQTDVHLPGKDGFPERDASFPTESGPSAFLDDNGYPWVVSLPAGWRHPVERKPIWQAYRNFNRWVANGGTRSRNWYRRPFTDDGSVGPEQNEFMTSYEFTIGLP